MRVAYPRYAAASCWCRSLPSVTPPYHMLLLCCRSGCACPSMRKHRDLHLRPQRQFFTSIFPVFFCEDRRRQTAADNMHKAKRYYRGRNMCACRILSLRRRVAFVIACHVLSSCSLVLNKCLLLIFYSKPHHTCPFSLPGGP